jgi:pimeloyl-ACP methyl ester carboxylesterase/MFS family permease
LKTQSAESGAYRASVLLFLILVYIFNFLDRQIIGILAVPIKEDLGLNDTQLSLMGGLAFGLFYSVLGIPIAWLSDRSSRTWIITGALALWSLFTAACGLAQNFWQLFLARMGVGVGEAGGVAPSYSIIADYFPPEKRARALAIFSFGIPLGSALGIVLGGVLTSLLDWRWAFIIIGMAGLVFAPLFRIAMKEPVRGRYDPPGVDTKPASIGAVYRKLTQKKSFLFLSFGAAFSSMMGYGLFFWIPSFLVRSYGEALPEFISFMPEALLPAGAPLILYAAYFYGTVVLVGGIIGIWAGGMLGDYLGKSDRAAYACVPAIAFLCVVPFFGFAIWSPSLTMVFLAMVIPTALGLMWLGPVLSAFQHIVPPNMRATASAMFLLINNLMGLALGNLSIGMLSDGLTPMFGDEALRYALTAGGVYYLVAGVLLLIAAPLLRKDWEGDAAPAAPDGGPDGAAASEDQSAPEGQGGPAEADDSFRSAFFTNADGLKIEFRDYPPQGEVSGPPVLCLHGLTRNVRDFETVAPRLAAIGRRVICASQRGRSRSDHDPQPERYNPGVYTADMIGLLDHLGVEKAVFIGTSMGGLMTMVAAATAPGRVAGAVINDVGPVLDEAGLNRIRAYVGKFGAPAASWAEAAERCRSINGAAFPNHDDAFWAMFARRVFREAAPDRIVLDYDPAIGRMVAEDSSDLADLWPLFEALKPVPLLLVRGEISDLLSLSTVEEMRGRKPDLEFVQAAGIGHAPFLDEADTAPAVDGFVERIQ